MPGMGQSVAMLVLAVLVAAAMVLTLAWFFKRLRRIEEARWGAARNKQGLSSEMEWTSALRRVLQSLRRRGRRA